MARKPRGADRPNTIGRVDYLRIATELIEANKEVQRCVEAQAAARGVVSGIIKRFEGLGGDKKVMKMLRDMAKLDDRDREDFMRTFFAYGEFEELKLYRPGTEEAPQGEMFVEETEAVKQGHRDATVNMDGYNTSKAGGTLNDNPHEPGSRDHQTWVSGFNDQQRERETAGSEGARAPATRERDPRRGRRPAAAAPADDIGEPVGTA